MALRTQSPACRCRGESWGPDSRDHPPADSAYCPPARASPPEKWAASREALGGGACFLQRSLILPRRRSTEGRSKAEPRPPSALALGNWHPGHFKRRFSSYLFFPKFTVSLKKRKKNSTHNFCDLLCNEHAKGQNDIFSTKYLVPVIF